MESLRGVFAMRRAYFGVCMRIFVVCSMICLPLFTVTRVCADEIHLANGSTIQGVIREENEGSVTVEVGIGTITFPKEDIANIVRQEQAENRNLESEWKAKKEARQKEYDAMKKKAAAKEKRAAEKNDIQGMPSAETGNANDLREDYSSPEATFRTYMAACKALSFEKSDACYTRRFREFIKTDSNYRAHRHTGQLRNEYNYLHDQEYTLEAHGNKAIMRFAPERQRPAPLYFVKEGGQWKIDAMFAYNNIIMESGSRWHWKNPDVNNEARWLSR